MHRCRLHLHGKNKKLYSSIEFHHASATCQCIANMDAKNLEACKYENDTCPVVVCAIFFCMCGCAKFRSMSFNVLHEMDYKGIMCKGHVRVKTTHAAVSFAFASTAVRTTVSEVPWPCNCCIMRHIWQHDLRKTLAMERIMIHMRIT